MMPMGTILGPEMHRTEALILTMKQGITLTTDAPFHVVDDVFADGTQLRSGSNLVTGTTTQLDVLGRPMWDSEAGVRGALSRVTQFEFDAAGHLRRTVAPDSAVTEADYDLLDRVTQVRQQAQWNTSQFETSSYTYNELGQLSSVTDPQGYETVQHYNGFGAATSRSGPASVVDSWTYDEHGRKVSHTAGGVVGLQYIYEGPLLKQVETAAELAMEFTYDSLGRVETARRSNQGASDFFAKADREVLTAWSYDDVNRTVAETTTVGRRASHTVTSVPSRADRGQLSAVVPD
jgi:YD repeat-containing protein